MKKVVFVLVLILSLQLALAQASTSCELAASLLNQDPYPAVPGDYVKFVFQVTGTENPSCKDVYFEIIPAYPISLDPNTPSKVQIKGGTFVPDYSGNLQIPYKVRIDDAALDGENEIRVRFSSLDVSFRSTEKKFNFSIQNPKADFEVFVKNYNYQTKILTLQIVNIGKKDVKALIMEIPKQPNINVQGTNINVVGDLDSKDYTTTDFSAIPVDGEIKLKISYTDSIDVRRKAEKSVIFSSENFAYTQQSGNKNNIYYAAGALVIIVIIVIWYLRRRYKRKHHLR